MQKQIAIGAFLALAAYGLGCSDDSDDGEATAGTGGTAGSAGAAGSSSTAGAAGAAGSGDAAGAAGAAGSAGAAGAAGSSGGGPTGSISFFVTSTGSGADGGNVGGLEGADEKCQTLAEAVDAGDRTWRAYLSTTDEDAIDRIGEGPWFNAEGVQVAADLASLHTDGLPREPVQLVLDENGDVVPGAEHDILTGSTEEGTLFVGDDDQEGTCENWTSNAEDAPGPRVGHSDIPDPMFSPSWNSAHNPAGCAPAQLTMVGGAGRLYCFASD